MKVAEFINKINEIGYDDNTELIFGTSSTNDFYEIKFSEIYTGEDVDDKNPNIIDIEFEISSELKKDLQEDYYMELIEDMQNLLYRYK